MDSATPPELTLPAPIEPDWKSIRERYLEGEELAQIAADNSTTVNAISIRASREKWKAAQFEQLLRDERLISNEVRNCLLVSILKESRFFQKQDPSSNPIEADAWSKVRSRLVDTAAKLLHWDADPLDRAKPARAIDV